jgi:hypothetical protein
MSMIVELLEDVLPCGEDGGIEFGDIVVDRDADAQDFAGLSRYMSIIYGGYAVSCAFREACGVFWVVFRECCLHGVSFRSSFKNMASYRTAASVSKFHWQLSPLCPKSSHNLSHHIVISVHTRV